MATKADADHGHFYGKMTTVATSGGEYTSPVDAMNDLANWCGTPSAANPCLLKIMPGVYDIGTSSVDMVSYVDLEGSGQAVTRIVGKASGYMYGVVNAAEAEIRNITIEDNGGNNGNAVDSSYTNSVLSSVTLLSTGSNPYAALRVNSSEALVKISKIESQACTWAVLGVNNTKLRLQDSEVISSCETTGSGTGMYFGGSSTMVPYLEIIDSQVRGGWNSVRVWYGDVRIANSKISGRVPVDFYATYGSIKCLNSYDENFDLITCP